MRIPVYALLFWYDILTKFNVVSKMLQAFHETLYLQSNHCKKVPKLKRNHKRPAKRFHELIYVEWIVKCRIQIEHVDQYSI